MTQQYSDPVAIGRMRNGLCPECGGTTASHTDDIRFWIPRTCLLLARGVDDRILEQRRLDGDR